MEPFIRDEHLRVTEPRPPGGRRTWRPESSAPRKVEWPPCPPTTTTRSHPRWAASSASSRSVASLASGCRSTNVPLATAASTAAGSAERTPTMTSTANRARSRIRPESAAITTSGGGRPCFLWRSIASGEYSATLPIGPPPALPGSGSRGRRRMAVALSSQLSRLQDSFVRGSCAFGRCGRVLAAEGFRGGRNGGRPEIVLVRPARPSGAAQAATRRTATSRSPIASEESGRAGAAMGHRFKMVLSSPGSGRSTRARSPA